jgi:hypothetical protein
MFDMAGTAADKAGNALHGGHSTDQFVADTLSTAATANSAGIANIADTEHPSMDRRRGHTPVPEGRGRPEQADQKVQLSRKTLSSNRPPPKG